MGVVERKKREKETRRREILLAAEKLFSGKKGIESTMDDLAEKSELGKGTLYLYFPTKRSILQALAAKGIILLKKRLSRDIDFSKSGLEQLSAAGDIFVKFLKEKPFYAALILQFEKTVLEKKETGKKILLVEPVLEILKNVLENGMSDQTLRDDIQPKELVTILWSQMLGILNTLSGRKELFTIYKIDENWIIRGHFRVIMRGMKPKEG